MSNVKGKIKLIKETEVVTDKFKKREFVLTTLGTKYPQVLLFQAFQDKCSKLDNVNKGDIVDVEYNLLGKEWTSPKGEVKYFNTLEAWFIKKAEGEQEAPQAPGANEESDDLPF